MGLRLVSMNIMRSPELSVSLQRRDSAIFLSFSLLSQLPAATASSLIRRAESKVTLISKSKDLQMNWWDDNSSSSDRPVGLDDSQLDQKESDHVLVQYSLIE